jgi:hypothetical protein
MKHTTDFSRGTRPNTPMDAAPEHLPVKSPVRRWIQILGWTLAGGLLVGALWYGATVAATYAAIAKYTPQDGDMIFQSLPYGPVVWAIEGVTKSPYSHCGIVGQKNRQWVVYEALGSVRVTPLQEFLWRGRGGGFAVYRLRDEHREHIPETLRCCENYLGRPYDIRYRLDDEKIYCSELVYKAFRDATDGQQLGELVKFGDMNWGPYEVLIGQIEGGPVPVDREMITPRDLAKARQLEPVFSHNIAVEAAKP